MYRYMYMNFRYVLIHYFLCHLSSSSLSPSMPHFVPPSLPPSLLPSLSPSLPSSCPLSLPLSVHPSSYSALPPSLPPLPPFLQCPPVPTVWDSLTSCTRPTQWGREYHMMKQFTTWRLLQLKCSQVKVREWQSRRRKIRERRGSESSRKLRALRVQRS